MKKSILSALVVGTFLGAVGSTPALADHNSPYGDCWANMPNNIHNTRVETRETDEQDAWLEFIQSGDANETINSCLLDSTSTTTQGNAQTDSGSQR